MSMKIRWFVAFSFAVCGGRPIKKSPPQQEHILCGGLLVYREVPGTAKGRTQTAAEVAASEEAASLTAASEEAASLSTSEEAASEEATSLSTSEEAASEEATEAASEEAEAAVEAAPPQAVMLTARVRAATATTTFLSLISKISCLVQNVFSQGPVCGACLQENILVFLTEKSSLFWAKHPIPRNFLRFCYKFASTVKDFLANLSFLPGSKYCICSGRVGSRGGGLRLPGGSGCKSLLPAI